MTTTRPYKKRIVVGENVSRLMIADPDTDRRVDMLMALYKTGLMTLPLFIDLFPPQDQSGPLAGYWKNRWEQEGRKTAAPVIGQNHKKNLRKLMDNQLAKVVACVAPPEPVYAITRDGVWFLMDSGRLKKDDAFDGWREQDPHPSYNHVDHTLRGARWYTNLMVATRASDKIDLVHFERESGRLKLNWKLSLTDKWVTLRPDLFVVLRDRAQKLGKQMYAYFVEIHDRVSPQKMKERYALYSLFSNDGVYKDFFENLDMVRVLTIAKNDAEGKRMLQLPTNPQIKYPNDSRVPASYRIPSDALDMFFGTSEVPMNVAPTNALARIYGKASDLADDPAKRVPLTFSSLKRVE